MSRPCCRRRRRRPTGRRRRSAGASARGRGYLQAVRHPHAIRLDDLVAIDEQKAAIDENTRQFVAGLPANNVLLTGSRGTGKSSLVKAMLAKYAAKGLRLIEVDKADLVDLPDIADPSTIAASASSSSATTSRSTPASRATRR